MLLEKVDQNSPKFLEICYVPIPLIVPNFIVLGQTMNEKSATKIFYALQYFGAPRGPPGPKFISRGTDVQKGQNYQST